MVTVASDDAHLAFFTLHFAGWRCRIDNRPAGIDPLPGSGLISLHVPQGTHQVDLRFGRTTARWAGDLLSLVALGAIACLLWPSITAARARLLSLLPMAGRLVVGVLVLIAGLWAAGKVLSMSDRFRAQDDLSMDFDRIQREVKPISDFLIGQPCGHKRYNF